MSEIIVSERTISGFEDSGEGIYMTLADGLFTKIMPSREYEVVFDGTKHTCMGKFLLDENGNLVVYIGNGGIVGYSEDTGEPFIIAYQVTQEGAFADVIATTLGGDSHIVSVTKADGVLIEQEFDGFGFESIFNGNILQLYYSVADLIVGENYNLKIDGTEYQCEAKSETFDEMDMIVLGNLRLASEDYENTGESFLIATASPIASETPFGITSIVMQADSEKTSYTIGISPAEKAKTGVDIVLYDRTGEPVTYEGIETITTDTPTDGERATFTYGTLLGGVEIEPNFKNGNQKISVPDGNLVKEATVKKPETLLPKYIKKNIEIAGIVGEFVGDETEKTVELAMADGDQVIKADTDTVMTKVIVKKPETLIGDNIVKGVEIAGVAGTHSCTGYTAIDIANGDVDGEVESTTVSEIKNYAFGGTKITKVAFPSCSSVGKYAFAECSLLSDIELDYAGISMVDTGAFMGTAISAVSLPSCTSIKASAFSGCSSLQEVYAPMCSIIESDAFNGCSSLSKITLSTGVSVINAGCFCNCVNLKDLGETWITKVYEKAFYGCKSLERITFSGGFPVILGGSAFNGCSNLSIVEGTLSVAGSTREATGTLDVFANCNKLKSIVWGYYWMPLVAPNGMFRSCSALSIVSLWSQTKVFPIESNCFYGTPIDQSSYLGKFGSIYVPSNLFYSFRSASGWSTYSARMVSYKV